ncbi:MAG: multidrug effflux MFS transporter [Actinomycetota bacterium]
MTGTANNRTSQSGATPSGPSQRERDIGVGPNELLVLISAIMALMALGIDLMLPAFDDIRAAYDLGEGSNRTGQVITVFFLGLAAAQLFYGPLADRFGRKPVLYAGIVVSTLGAVGSALAPSFELLLASRFLWGVGAAGARVVSTAIIRDRFVGSTMAKAMSQVMAVFILVPVVAPSIGAGLIAVLPWRSVFWFCVVWSGVIGLWGLRLNETLDPAHVRPLSVRSSVAGYRQVARTPITFGYTMATVFIQGAMTSYLAVSELIIGEIFDRRAAFPFIFGVVALGFGVAALVNGRLVERRGIDRMVTTGFLINLPFGAVLVAVSVAGDGVPSIWVFIPLLAAMLSTFMLLMPNLNTAAMTPVGKIAGSASAFTGALRVAGGAALASVATRWVTDSVTPFAVAMLVFCAAAAATVAIVRARAADRPPS